MKEGLKKPLKAFALLATFELALVLLVAVGAWAIARHDLASLDRSFYDDVRVELFAQIVGGLFALIVVVNVVGIGLILVKGEKAVAAAAAMMTAAVGSLFFLPIKFAAVGLGGVLGLIAALKILKLLWRGVSWPFRKMFGKKPKPEAASAAAKPAPATKSARS